MNGMNVSIESFYINRLFQIPLNKLHSLRYLPLIVGNLFYFFSNLIYRLNWEKLVNNIGGQFFGKIFVTISI